MRKKSVLPGFQVRIFVKDMKILLLVVGKTSTGFVRVGMEEYAGRINRFMPFEIKVIPDIKTTRKLTENAQKEAEGIQILAQIQPTDHVVLLDEHGKEMTSREFSSFIEQKAQTVQKNMIFVVGGPYGFSQAVYERANSLLSLSRMTFPHELVRLFFTEQIYRAITISRNMPYHHD